MEIFKDDTYLPFKDIYSPQMVFVVKLNSPIKNRRELYCSLPCEIKDTYNDGDITSIRWMGLIKGKKGGFFPNAMMLDIYIDGKEEHTKIFENGKIQICNASSENKCIEIANKICHVLMEANYYLYNIIKKDTYRCFFDKLLEKSKGEQFLSINSLKLKFPKNVDSEFGRMEFCKHIIENRIVWPDFSDESDALISADLKKRFSDILELDVAYVALVSRINLFMSLPKIDENIEYSPTFAKKCCIIITFYFGFSPNMYELNSFFLSKGYDSHFPNICGSKLYLMRDQDKMTFYPKGFVRFSGRNINSMEKTYKDIMQHLVLIKDKIKLPNKGENF
jgi:hypothetical protein